MATGVDAVSLARAYYLDEHHQFGCAETSFMVLKTAYGLDDPMDPSAAVALNGGIGWSGGHVRRHQRSGPGRGHARRTSHP